VAVTPEQLRQRRPGPQIRATTAREAVPGSAASPSTESELAVAPVAAAPTPAPSPDLTAPPAPAAPVRRMSSMPTSPEDAEGLYRGVIWVARAAQECGRVLTALEERLDALERQLGAPEVPAPPATADGGDDAGAGPRGTGRVAATRQALAAATRQTGRLAAEVARSQRRVDGRFTALEARLADLESLPAVLGAVQHQVEEVARVQRSQPRTVASSPVVQSMQRSIDELGGELAAVGEWLGHLDARMDQLDSLPAAMEEVATTQFERLVSEMLSLPVDIEGLYRELESVTERVAARDGVAARALEQAASVAEALPALRQDLDRVIGGLAEARRSEAAADDRRRILERRLEALESPGAEVERLYRALDRMVGGQAAASEAGASEAGGRGAGVRGAGVRGAGARELVGHDGGPTSWADPAGRKGSQRAVEVLTAELERIRQSIEVLTGQGTGGDGPRA
jgi:hypothetical protein